MGRKRKSGPRQGNGQPSRKKADVAAQQAQTERGVMQTALRARVRVFGVTAEQARSQSAGTVLGRLMLTGEISGHQLTAAQYFLADRNAYHRGILAPMEAREPRAEGLSGSTKPYEQFVADAKDRWSDVLAALDAVCQESGSKMPATAVEMIVVRDISAPYAVGSLRIALNRLVKFYLIGNRKAA